MTERRQDGRAGAAESARLFRQYVCDHFAEALERHEIFAWYQPLVRIQTRSVCGTEALARWESPMYGLMEARRFVPVLEQEGLVHKLDLYMIDLACRQTRELLDAGDQRFLPISVNISPNICDVADPVVAMADACARHGIPMGAVELELRGRVPADLVTRLQAHGVHVWADNFAGGHLPVSVLADSPYTAIKLSRGMMTTNYERAGRLRVVVEGILEITKRLGVVSAAKGVENEAQLDYLRRIGCELAQGYLFAKPAPLVDLPGQLEAGGVGYEAVDRRGYYEAGSRINLLASSYREAAGGMGVQRDAAPVAVVEITADRMRYLGVNQAYLDFLTGEGYKGTEEAERLLSDPSNVAAVDLRRAAERARETGTDQVASYMGHGRLHLTQVHPVSSDADAGSQIVLLSTSDMGRFDEASLNVVSQRMSDKTSLVTKEALWDSLLAMRFAGYFWKDVDRRFVGVSPSFLDFYGFDSVEDVLGKTDEDMGWHVNPAPFKAEEELVLSKGTPVVEAHGRCIARGRICSIIANKVPIYQNGKIVGLLGCFRVDEVAEAAKANLPTASGESDAAQIGPLSEVFNEYRQAFDRDGTDFVICAVQLAGLEELARDHGEEAVRAATRACEAQIERLLHNSGVYAHYDHDIILIMRQFGRVGDADVFVDSLRSLALLLDDGESADGLSVRVAATRYASCGTPDVMAEVMGQRFQEAGIVERF